MQQPILQSLHSNTTLNITSLPELSLNIQQDLMQVMATLQSSLYLVYLHYKPYAMQYENYLKLAVLMVLTYFVYKLGGMTVTDKIEYEKEQLRAFIQRKNSVQQKIPKQIKQINSTTLKILILSIVLASAYAYAFFNGHAQKLAEFQNPIIICAILTMCYLIYSNISKLFLAKRLRQVSKLQQTYSQKLNHFAASLGSKVIAILRNHLCRETQLKFSSSKNINDCQKSECKQLRALIKHKNDAIATLVEETVDFEWCSICKRKQPFDECLHFQALPYQQLLTENEPDELKNKIGYLIDGMERIKKWLAETSPCNCSKLYWATSTKQIIEFKKTQKALDIKIKQLDAKDKHQ